jgi:hypothetical protein
VLFAPGALRQASPRGGPAGVFKRGQMAFFPPAAVVRERVLLCRSSSGQGGCWQGWGCPRRVAQMTDSPLKTVKHDTGVRVWRGECASPAGGAARLSSRASRAIGIGPGEQAGWVDLRQGKEPQVLSCPGTSRLSAAIAIALILTAAGVYQTLQESQELRPFDSGPCCIIDTFNIYYVA